MQTISIAVLIVIAGLIGALLACATSLINRARAANTTLRRIEETLLAMNRVRAIDSAVKSTRPVKQSESADIDGAHFLTIRELKTMSGGGKRSIGGAPISNGLRPARFSSNHRAPTDPQSAPSHEGIPEFQDPEVIANGVSGASPNSGDPAHSSAAITQCDSAIETGAVTPSQEEPDAAEDQFECEPSFVMRWPTPNQNAAESMRGAPAAVNPELLQPLPVGSPDNSAALMESAAPPAEEEAREVKASTTNHILDESRRKRKEQELLMIISSRRRRARAGR